MAADRFDDGWQDLAHPWERLKWARVRWQRQAGAINGSGKDAAISLGMEPGTYRAYERSPEASKHTPLGHQEAAKFAKKFKVNWLWLLINEGSPFDDQLPEAQDRVVRAMAAANPDQQSAIADMVEKILGASARTGTGG